MVVLVAVIQCAIAYAISTPLKAVKVKFCHYPLHISSILFFDLNIYIYHMVVLTLPE